MNEFEEIEEGDRESGVRGQVGKLYDYFRNGSNDDFAEWLKAVSAVPGGTISRSEAALLLGCSRQRIHQIARDGEVRCWHFHGGYLNDVTIYSELSVLDLLDHAERNGRPVADFHALKYVKWLPEIQAYYDQKREPQYQEPEPSTTKLADRIREFVLSHYVTPTREKGDINLTISARHVHEEMNLTSRYPAVCAALDSRIFATQAQAERIERTGPSASSNVTWKFRLT